MKKKRLTVKNRQTLGLREVHATAPVTVEYSLTEYGKTLKPVVLALYSWGSKHRERILKGKKR